MSDTTTQKYIDWIREGLRQQGKTQIGLAGHLGIAHPQITQLLKGRRSIKVAELPKIAEYLGIDLPQDEIQPTTERFTSVRVVGVVEAGAFREVNEFSQDEPEELSLPADSRFPGARQMAFDVSGDSMNDLKPRPILPGDRAVCVAYEDIAHEATLRDGMVVVVERSRDGGHTREWSIKQVEIYEDRTEFSPRSTNPNHKPIVIHRDMSADTGERVEVIALVRRVVNDLPF